MQRLSLTSAEIALLMAALPADPRPFIGDSDLVNVDSTVLYRRMEAAREGVLARRLATVMLARHPDAVTAHLARWLGGREDFLKA